MAAYMLTVAPKNINFRRKTLCTSNQTVAFLLIQYYMKRTKWKGWKNCCLEERLYAIS